MVTSKVAPAHVCAPVGFVNSTTVAVVFAPEASGFEIIAAAASPKGVIVGAAPSKSCTELVTTLEGAL